MHGHTNKGGMNTTHAHTKGGTHTMRKPLQYFSLERSKKVLAGSTSVLVDGNFLFLCHTPPINVLLQAPLVLAPLRNALPLQHRATFVSSLDGPTPPVAQIMCKLSLLLFEVWFKRRGWGLPGPGTLGGTLVSWLGIFLVLFRLFFICWSVLHLAQGCVAAMALEERPRAMRARESLHRRYTPISCTKQAHAS